MLSLSTATDFQLLVQFTAPKKCFLVQLPPAANNNLPGGVSQQAPTTKTWGVAKWAWLGSAINY